MAYHHLRSDGLDRTPDFPCDRRSITDAAALSALHAVIYEADPGEPLARSFHYHERREEVFLVLAGELHVETADGTVVVETGDVFVATPESPIRPFNPATGGEPVRVLGAGAPVSDPGRPATPPADSG